MCVHICLVRQPWNGLNQILYFVKQCSSPGSTKEGNREIEAGVSPTEPQEDGKCIITTTL